MLRFEIGKIHLKQGELDRAELHLRSLQFGRTDPLANLLTTPVEFYLGELYRERGDHGTARVHYERFLRWWRDADPELQPWVEEGRLALEQLDR